MSPSQPKDFTSAGLLLENGETIPCTLHCEDGRAVIDLSEPDRYDFKAVLIKDMVNAHTHCGDYGLKVPPGMSLEELVAPPDGLKHRYLSRLSDDGLRENMTRFGMRSAELGSASFIDFREGGADGCRALRACCPDAVILGRPTSPEYDPEEVAEILSVADGIGIPSISDMDLGYIESVADDVRRARKTFAIHASERVREDIDTVLSLDPAFVVHMCEATDDDLSKCAEAEVPVVVCPSSNRYFGKETPIVRMLDAGVDVAVGTDNGMLCEPDIVSETRILAGMIAQQGGDPEDAWKCLSVVACKLLNRIRRMECEIRERYVTVIPQADSGADGLDSSSPFRVKMN
ncbi:amidohydrolase family protein [methanogenic archaeon mixed culture ISO4-G1]|nr:amidohydrolase family protein [methanogenic archaeon mixed culture ISO4-G1]